MIKTHEKFGNDKIQVEINWDKSVMPCKKIRFCIGDVCEVIDKGDLFALLTIIADNEEQERFTIVKSEEVVGVRKMMSVRTKKDIKAGETIVFPMTQYVTKQIFDKMIEVGAIKPEDMISEEDAKIKEKTGAQHIDIA